MTLNEYVQSKPNFAKALDSKDTSSRVSQFFTLFGHLPLLYLAVTHCRSATHEVVMYLDNGDELLPVHMKCGKGWADEYPEPCRLYNNLQEIAVVHGVKQLAGETADYAHLGGGEYFYEDPLFEQRKKEIKTRFMEWKLSLLMEHDPKLFKLCSNSATNVWLRNLVGSFATGEVTGEIILDMPWMYTVQPVYKFSFKTSGLCTSTSFFCENIRTAVDKIHGKGHMYSEFPSSTRFVEAIKAHPPTENTAMYYLSEFKLPKFENMVHNEVIEPATTTLKELYKQIAKANYSNPVAVVIPTRDSNITIAPAMDPEYARIIFQKGRSYVYRKFGDSHRDSVSMKELLDDEFHHVLINCSDDKSLDMNKVKEQILFGSL